jgi:hypothetical protein
VKTFFYPIGTRPSIGRRGYRWDRKVVHGCHSRQTCPTRRRRAVSRRNTENPGCLPEFTPAKAGAGMTEARPVLDARVMGLSSLCRAPCAVGRLCVTTSAR